MSNSTMYAPGGAVGVEYIGPTGSYVSGAGGVVSVDPSEVPQLLRAGWLSGDFVSAVVSAALRKFCGDRLLSSAGAAIGGTDTNVSTIAFTYQIGAAAGVVNTFKAKVAVAAGTALGALGTVPQGMAAGLLMQINAAGTISYKSAPANYGAGYATEAAALAAIEQVAPDAGNALVCYVTLTTNASHAWIAGTDAFAGGASGNPAATTTYYNAGLGA